MNLPELLHQGAELLPNLCGIAQVHGGHRDFVLTVLLLVLPGPGLIDVHNDGVAAAGYNAVHHGAANAAGTACHNVVLTAVIHGNHRLKLLYVKNSSILLLKPRTARILPGGGGIGGPGSWLKTATGNQLPNTEGIHSVTAGT